MKILRALRLAYLLVALFVCLGILQVLILFDPLLYRIEQRRGHKCEMEIK
jgi:hypothetical protein